jgi:hypothetical protein
MKNQQLVAIMAAILAAGTDKSVDWASEAVEEARAIVRELELKIG